MFLKKMNLFRKSITIIWDKYYVKIYKELTNKDIESSPEHIKFLII